MNEQIKQLAGKALDQAVPYTWTSLMPHELDNFAEKFAELIVRECIQVLDDCHVNIPDGVDFGSDLTWVSATLNSTVNFSMGKIKKHFGVKE